MDIPEICALQICVRRKKTQLMLLGSQQNLRNAPTVTVKFREQQLTPCSETKNLGIIFDRTLSWDSHVSLVTKRCFGILAGLSHLKHCLPASVLTTLVNALVLSQVRYCLSVYGNGTSTNLSRIQKIINYSAKVIFGSKKFDHASDLREKLGWLSAEEMVRYQTLTLTQKVYHTGEPADLARHLYPVSETRSRQTRQDSNLLVPMSKTDMGKRRFSARVPDQFNALPPEMEQLPVPSFCRSLSGIYFDVTEC